MTLWLLTQDGGQPASVLADGLADAAGQHARKPLVREEPLGVTEERQFRHEHTGASVTPAGSALLKSSSMLITWRPWTARMDAATVDR
jgi:hypothetical protein